MFIVDSQMELYVKLQLFDSGSLMSLKIFSFQNKIKLSFYTSNCKTYIRKSWLYIAYRIGYDLKEDIYANMYIKRDMA